jgi:hypothetical protein
MFSTEDPFVRAESINKKASEKFGGSWGTLLNIPLAGWASKQDYKQIIYHKNYSQVFVWNEMSSEPVIEAIKVKNKSECQLYHYLLLKTN